MKTLKFALETLDIRFACDDFGPGPTRLIELVEVPADYLKSDMGLLKNIHQATSAHKDMVSVLVDQAQKAGRKVLRRRRGNEGTGSMS
jgi:EAL domain-containing protein (putative c-di-GMP-specific phosphodiesterase class I)